MLSEIGLSKLILPGSLICMRINNNPTWSLNIAFNCSDESIDIPLTSDLMKYCLFVDTIVTIKFKNDVFEYIINGYVSKIELCGSPFIRVQVIDLCGNINNRIFPRHYVYAPAIICIENNTPYYCTVENISLGGISFFLNKSIPTSTNCEANIFLNDKNSIYCKGTILRSSPKGLLHEYSMQFTFMDEEDSNVLYSYLDSIDSHYDYLRSKYLISP